ncbi:MAG TPA: glycosyltransferase family 4 protein [Verrucomicrobiae bacterium]|nr:glycosyltransferase family 4 protein [Verrucomicrobiae bacterium]
MKPLKVAILTTDKRDHGGNYANPAPGFGAAPEALLQGFARLPGLEVHVVSCTRQPLRSPEKIAENLWYHGLHVPKIGWMRTLYYGCVRATRKKLREIGPDLVHGQGTEHDCAISAVLSGFPNLLTIHGNMRSVARFYRARPGSFYWLAARLEAFALRRTGGVFCNSIYTENLIRPSTQKTWRVPNAVRFAFLDTPLAKSSKPKATILNIGSLSPHKRQREVLAMAMRLWQRGVRFELRFAGNLETKTEYGADFARELKAAEKSGYARHIGELPVGELISALDSASALVHVSREESFGLAVAEALARNLKLFGSRTGGMPDIAEGVEGAELFAAEDWTELEASITRWLWADCPRPASAAAVMRERYDPNIIARRHLEIYQETLDI